MILRQEVKDRGQREKKRDPRKESAKQRTQGRTEKGV